jgi:hypothetical protein
MPKKEEASTENVEKTEKPQRSAVTEEAEAKQTENSVKEMLAAQEKVQVFVPLIDGEPKGTQLPVEINGYKMFVPKGVPGVEVPRTVAEIIWQSIGVYDESSSALRSQNDPSRPLRTDLQSETDRSTIGA